MSPTNTARGSRNQDVDDEGGDNDRSPKEPTGATLLVELLKASGTELWHSPNQEPYATVTVDQHREHWRINSRAFKRWLGSRYYDETARTPGAQHFTDALGIIEEIALRGKEYPVSVRVAECDGAIYLDLCDAEWRVVKIDRNGWQVVSDPPVRFRRDKAMQPLPEPQRGGELVELRAFINVSDEHWVLICAYLVAALRPDFPFPVLLLHGEQGSAKSTVGRMLRNLIDPNRSNLRSPPKEERDLMIAATNGWIVAMDNLSHIPQWLSDALCRLSTGGGFSTRTLYENDEETIFDAMRPIILTGIEEVATRSDLIDRTLQISLPPIPEHRRRPESELWPAFHDRAIAP